MKALLFLMIGAAFLSSIEKKIQPVSRMAAAQDMPSWRFESKPYWSDEFNKTGQPDPNKWTYDVGGKGWGNKELQYYTAGDNVTVTNGLLTITARKEEKEGNAYTSSRMVTKGKADFLYGRVVVRAKIPSGVGTWPAIWLLASDNTYGGWPASGEIDIMEHVGYDQNKVHFSVHTASFNHVIHTERTAIKEIPTASSKFHNYRVDWTPDSVTGYIDDEKYFEFMNDRQGFKSWPFDKRFHLLLNIAVGGNWGGVKGVDEQVFPAAMQVDYVRIYKLVEK
ncbi:MAG: glycoside hydrolase family 16 protein [Sphingobacteriaceae bacterium]